MGKYSVRDRPYRPDRREGREDIEVENGLFPHVTQSEELQ